MCLLEEVLAWDPQDITCRSISHRAADHPLRAHTRLGAACAIEYAAQAMALHGALLQLQPQLLPPPQSASSDSEGSSFGLLASAREVELAVARLDDIDEDLLVSARRLHADAGGALYTFSVHGGQRLLARGRVSLRLQSGAVHTPPATDQPS